MNMDGQEGHPVMYMFVNSDLNMSKGQLVAQCCHMSHIITDECVTAMYEEHPASSDTLEYMRWRKSCVKVVLRASGEQLHSLSKLPYARHFLDEGNRIPQGSLTVVGLLPRPPASVQKDVNVANFKLL
jgi:peptidyl-tRNA hydrolase